MNAAHEIIYEPPASEERIGLFSSATSLKVRFVAASPLQLQIKHAMKTSASIQNKPILPSLFQIAAHFEDFISPGTSKFVPSSSETPFADMMLYPKKLAAILKNGKIEDRTANQSSAKRATRSAAPKNRNGSSAGESSNRSLGEPKRTEFNLEAPFAESVKLAADFTDWEQFPLNMTRTKNGVWHATVPLLPGQYSYRFIVDGQWCDDPNPVQLVPNPFGTSNAVVKVT
jgi:hypothetical protein